MYPLDRGLWGPTVRITHLRDELLKLVDLDLIEGYRGPRRAKLARYATSGRLARPRRHLRRELEHSCRPRLDLAFLGLARALGSRCSPTFVMRTSSSPSTAQAHVRGGSGGRVPAGDAADGAVSSRMAFPTAGLAEAVLGPEAGSGSAAARRATARSTCRSRRARIASCTSATRASPAQGVDRLICRGRTVTVESGRSSG